MIVSHWWTWSCTITMFRLWCLQCNTICSLYIHKFLIVNILFRWLSLDLQLSNTISLEINLWHEKIILFLLWCFTHYHLIIILHHTICISLKACQLVYRILFHWDRPSAFFLTNIGGNCLKMFSRNIKNIYLYYCNYFCSVEKLFLSYNHLIFSKPHKIKFHWNN